MVSFRVNLHRNVFEEHIKMRIFALIQNVVRALLVAKKVNFMKSGFQNKIFNAPICVTSPKQRRPPHPATCLFATILNLMNYLYVTTLRASNASWRGLAANPLPTAPVHLTRISPYKCIGNRENKKRDLCVCVWV